MVDEKSSVDILIDNLNKRGIDCESNKTDRRFVLPSSEQLMKTKSVVAALDSCFFIAHDSYAAKAQTTSTYTGIYTDVYASAEVECKIFKKEWADIFFRSGKRKTGIKYIDNNLTITSSGWTPKSILSFDDVTLFLELSKQIAPLKLVIQKDYLPEIGELSCKTVVGIETNSWLYEGKDLDLLLDKGVQLIRSLKKSLK